MAEPEISVGQSCHAVTFRRSACAPHFYEREALALDREGAHPQRGHPVSHYRWDG
jgi:hypothetical protein